MKKFEVLPHSQRAAWPFQIFPAFLVMDKVPLPTSVTWYSLAMCHLIQWSQLTTEHYVTFCVEGV